MCVLFCLFSTGWIIGGEWSSGQAGGACGSCKQWSDDEAGLNLNSGVLKLVG